MSFILLWHCIWFYLQFIVIIQSFWLVWLIWVSIFHWVRYDDDFRLKWRITSLWYARYSWVCTFTLKSKYRSSLLSILRIISLGRPTNILKLVFDDENLSSWYFAANWMQLTKSLKSKDYLIWYKFTCKCWYGIQRNYWHSG